jgi:hypothetical protein
MPQFEVSPELAAPQIDRAATFNYAVNPDKVREACVTYMGQVLNSQSTYNDGGEKAGLLSNLAAVAVYLLATLSGLETYIYGLVSLRGRLDLVTQVNSSAQLYTNFCIGGFEFHVPHNEMAFISYTSKLHGHSRAVPTNLSPM